MSFVHVWTRAPCAAGPVSDTPHPNGTLVPYSLSVNRLHRRGFILRSRTSCTVLASWLLATVPNTSVYAFESRTGEARNGSVAAAQDEVETEDAEVDAAAPMFHAELDVRERADDLVGVAMTSSEGVVGRASLDARPIHRTGELLETVPGFIATQHSGDGKANQYFVRGFNLDHGTDFRVSVDGMPVNMPTHGHGQGYADLSFLIPELVDRVRFAKGTAQSDGGDFSAAGSADFELVNTLRNGFAEFSLGSYGYRRAVAGESFELGTGNLTAAVEVHSNDGPWRRGNDYERGNAFLRFRGGDANRSWSVTAMAYDGHWLSTDQVPQRAIDSGSIGRFGFVDPDPRGESSRVSLSSQFRFADDRSMTTLRAYTFTYDLRLISNFTYFLDDPRRGDEFEQQDDRTVFGFDLRHQRGGRFAGRRVEWEVGLNGRRDDIDNGLFRTEDLRTLDTVREDDIIQNGLGAFGEVTIHWSDQFRSTLGARVDHFDARVSSRLEANSGSDRQTLGSPKIGLVFGPWRANEIYASYGLGFHSNDARGTTIRVDPKTGEPVAQVQPLVRARGWELGWRSAAIRGLQTSVTWFRLELDSELVFVGDGGFTEPSGRSRRTGVEWTNALAIGSSWTAEFDVALVEAELVDEPSGAREIPGALREVVAAAVTWRKGDWSTTLRLRAFGGYPLVEDGSVEARDHVGLNARVARTFGGWTASLEGFNLLDRDDNDIEYYYASRLPGEPAGGVEDVHLHPVEKRTVRVSLAYRF